MVPYNMACIILFYNEARICCDQAPDAEECGLHIVFLQDIEYQGGIIGIGTVIKAECNFR